MDKQVAPKNFERGLNNNSLNAINDFLNTPIGKGLLSKSDDGHYCYQVFFRNNYIDFYWRGCRILSYHPNARINKYLIHHKYTGKPATSENNSYLSLDLINDDLMFDDWSFKENVLFHTEKTFSPWLKGINDGKAGEKCLLYEFFKKAKKSSFLDVEVAFSVDKGKERPSAMRIDMLQVPLDRPCFKFTEVKLDTDARLRSMNGTPEVIQQMQYYRRDFLGKFAENIKTSYECIAKNILFLELTERFLPHGYSGDGRQFFENINRTVSVDPLPHLLVIQTKDWNENDKRQWTRLTEILRDNQFPAPTKWSKDLK